MDSDFFKEVRNYFTTEFKQQIGVSLNEESSSVDKALSAIIPLGAASAIQRVENDKGGMSSVFSMAKSAVSYLPPKPDLASLHNELAENGIISELLGKHENAVNHAVAKYSGIKNESAGPLMLLGMSVMLKNLGDHASKNNLTPDQLDSYITGLKDKAKRELPEGIKEAGSLFGMSEGSVDDKHVVETVQTDSVQKKNKGWIFPIIFAVVIVIALIIFSRGCNTYLK